MKELSSAIINGNKVRELEVPHHSYIILDTNNFSVKRISAQKDEKLGYLYDWEK